MSLLLRLREVTLLRYLGASLGALAIDTGTFLLWLQLGMAPAPASALGYMLGIAAHWLLSSRAVFAADVAPRGPERHRQKGLFLVSALVGLGLTIAIVGAGSAAGVNPRLAKLVAIAVSFVVTWRLRSRLVFSARQAA